MPVCVAYTLPFAPHLVMLRDVICPACVVNEQRDQGDEDRVHVRAGGSVRARTLRQKLRKKRIQVVLASFVAVLKL